MVYEESGSPCLDTCTHLDTSSMCEDHKIDGCFCPPGVCTLISLSMCTTQFIGPCYAINNIFLRSCHTRLFQELCLMTFPWEGASLNLNVSANMTEYTTPVKFTNRTERNGMSCLVIISSLMSDGRTFNVELLGFSQYMFSGDMGLWESSNTFDMFCWRRLTCDHLRWKSIHLPRKLLLHSSKGGEQGEWTTDNSENVWKADN